MESLVLDLALAMARDVAGTAGAILTPAELDTMRERVAAGDVRALTGAQRWQWLSLGLQARKPSAFLRALRRCGALRELWPALDALFGVPQLSDAQAPIDVGEHQMRVVDVAAALGTPLAVRFAGLSHKLGKGQTPRDIWPSHYKHEARGHALLSALAERTEVPSDALSLAHLAIDECDRVHRATTYRAGALAALLERVRALEDPERFEQLLTVCACDFAAYAGHDASGYTKADILRKALRAYASVRTQGLPAQAALDARTVAVAEALRSFAFR